MPIRRVSLKNVANFFEKSTIVTSNSYHFSSSEPRQNKIKLTPQEVDNILRANEYTQEFHDCSVKSYDSNQLASNDPIEDTRAEASCLLTSGLLFGVFDGHGGGACAQVIAKRLYQYLAACLLPKEHLIKLINNYNQPSSNKTKLLKTYNDKVQLVEDIKKIYRNSFAHFLNSLLKDVDQRKFTMNAAIEKAFLSLDSDLSKEAEPNNGINRKTLSVAMSGSVACIAHIDGPHLHVAHVGDCCAVLGSLSETNSWRATKLTIEHNADNSSEVNRILTEHPNERNSVIRFERLLAQLAPFRAFGDFRFKWPIEILKRLPKLPYYAPPQNYSTPPYLTAQPEITHRKLTPRDKFLIIASDGLWDLVSPLETVRLVGEHMKGKVTLSPLKLPRKSMKLGEIAEILQQRVEGMKMRPKDSNAATHLIRNALGGTDYGIDDGKLSQLLTLPQDVVRVFRDDVTVTVIYFDSEYLRHCPVV